MLFFIKGVPTVAPTIYFTGEKSSYRVEVIQAIKETLRPKERRFTIFFVLFFI